MKRLRRASKCYIFHGNVESSNHLLFEVAKSRKEGTPEHCVVESEGRVFKLSSGNLIGFFTLFNRLKGWPFSCRFFPDERMKLFIFFITTYTLMTITSQEDRIIKKNVYSTFEIILLTGVERIFPGSRVEERRFWGKWGSAESFPFSGF